MGTLSLGSAHLRLRFGPDAERSDANTARHDAKENIRVTQPEHSFDPAAAGPDAFRKALGQFTTGVTIVTCATPDGPLGITANSFASLSLDPPLVLWSPAKRSARTPHFLSARFFAIHVLAATQKDVCEGFARGGQAFDLCAWQLDDRGVPVIDGGLARFDCETHAIHEGGDHHIIVGRVLRAQNRPDIPLVFHAGDFGGFSTG